MPVSSKCVDMAARSPDPTQRGRHRIGTRGLDVFRGLIRGIGGGLLATALMTLYRFPLFRAVPPTADFWATYISGGAPEASTGAGLVLHFVYGGVAGGLFGSGFSLLGFRTERTRRFAAIGLSFGYSLVLSVFGTRVIFKHLLDQELDPDEATIFHVGHVIYGLTLGTWLCSREQSGDVYK